MCATHLFNTPINFLGTTPSSPLYSPSVVRYILGWKTGSATTWWRKKDGTIYNPTTQERAEPGKFPSIISWDLELIEQCACNWSAEEFLLRLEPLVRDLDRFHNHGNTVDLKPAPGFQEVQCFGQQCANLMTYQVSLEFLKFSRILFVLHKTQQWEKMLKMENFGAKVCCLILL